MTRRGRRILTGALVVLGLVVAVLAWKLPPMAQLAVDTSAKWACQCRYIDGGDNKFCVAEDPLGFGGTDFRFEPEEKLVSASIWSVWESTASYDPGNGCVVW